MSREPTEHVASRCQWCGQILDERQIACANCGSVVPSSTELQASLALSGAGAAEVDAALLETSNPKDDAEQARQILKDLDAFVEDEPKVVTATRKSDPADDALVIIGILVIAGGFGAAAGWVLAPSVLHDLFQSTLGVDADSPDSFRRLGAFLGALVSMLFGATFATLIRR